MISTPSVPRLLGQGSANRVVRDRLLDLGSRKLPRRVLADRRLHRAGRDHVGVVAVAAHVQDLHRDPATGVMDRTGDRAVPVRLLRRRELRTASDRQSGVIRRDPAGHDESDAATRTLGVERRHPLEAVLDLLQPDMHRAHQNPVRQADEPEVERLEKVRERHAGLRSGAGCWMLGREVRGRGHGR
jgi:hypothetical protein